MKALIFSFFLFIQITLIAQPILKVKDVQIVVAPNTTINCSGGVTFVGTSILKNDGTIKLTTSTLANEDWIDSITIGVMDNVSTGNVKMNGLSPQRIYGATIFNNLTISMPTLVNIDNDVEVKNELHLDTGYINTGTNTIIVTNYATNAIQSASSFARSWVNGKLARSQNIGGTDYFYPIGEILGADTFYAPIFIDKLNNNNATYTAQYFNAPPIDFTNFSNPPIERLSQLEYWQVKSENYAAAADDDARLTLSYRATSVVNNNQATRDSLFIAQYTNVPEWMPTGGGFPAIAVNTTSPSFGYIKHTSMVNAFDVLNQNFTLASRSLYNILPYKIINWSATPKSNSIDLDWNVAMDFSVKKYIVEKAIGTNIYIPIHTATALQQNTSNYSYKDYTPIQGWNYYKLKVIDENNVTGLVGVKKVFFGKSATAITLFPNPATNTLTIQLPTYSNATTIKMFASNGKLIGTYKPSANKIEISIQNLAKGTYVLQVIDNDSEQTMQFVK